MQETDSDPRPSTEAASSPEIRGVALDMDGLLFDTEALYWDVGDTVLQRRGYRFSKELQIRMMGRVALAALQQMIDLHSLSDSPQELLDESDVLFSEKIAGGVPPMEGVNEWIGLLQELRIPFGLATSSRRKFVDVLFADIAWRDSLVFILSGDDVTRGKPDPEMYLTAADRLEIPPSQMLVLEDSGNGCAAAVAAGAQTVAVPSSHTQDQDFSGARLVADSLADPRLWKLVQGTGKGSTKQS